MTSTLAPRRARQSEVRDVAPFDRIELRDPANRVDLIVEPGPQLVVIEGRAELIRRVRTKVVDGILRITLAGGVVDHVRDAVTTSLTRQWIVYRIRAPRLYELRVAGLVSVSVSAFGADAPVVTRLGPPQPPTWPIPPTPPRRP